ncbi:hypothetical protein Trisim1_006661 [Trichoderma cf. simile WF8]
MMGGKVLLPCLQFPAAFKRTQVKDHPVQLFDVHTTLASSKNPQGPRLFTSPHARR